jgi:DNA-directed RNA polymerase subunit RPC12/RpoP
MIREDHAMNENKNIELTKEQLGEDAGGDKPKQDFGKTTVNCPSCGAENELPMLIRLGMKFNCAECGAELEI